MVRASQTARIPPDQRISCIVRRAEARRRTRIQREEWEYVWQRPKSINTTRKMKQMVTTMGTITKAACWVKKRN
jgi:REP element-mobilizing transposase RayT